MDTKMIYKSCNAELKSIDDNERSVTGIFSTSKIDRDEDIIQCSLIDLTDYRKNPVMLLQHNPSWVVAKNAWVKSENDELFGKVIFAETLLGDETYYLYKNGFMRAFSIGFYPLTDATFKGNVRVFSNIRLLEISCVSIPANADALTLDFVKSLKSNELSTEFMKQFVLNQFAEDIRKSKEEYTLLRDEIKGQVEYIKSFNDKYGNSIEDIIFEINNQKSKKEIEFEKNKIQLEIRKAFQNYK